MNEHRGNCHCGALSYRYATALLPERWSIRACQCSFCRAHAAVTTSDPGGSLLFEVTVPDRLQRYRFGVGSAEFLICRHCGIYLGASCEFEGARYGLPNLNAMRDLPARLAAPTPMNYESESLEERLARRASRWTPLLAGSL